MSIHDDATSNGEQRADTAVSSQETGAAASVQRGQAAQFQDTPQAEGNLAQTVAAGATAQDETSAMAGTNGVTWPPFGLTRAGGKRGKRVNQAKQAAALHRIRLTAPVATETEEVDVTTPVTANVAISARMTTLVSAIGSRLSSLRNRRLRKGRKDRLQNWDEWSRFRLWRRTRPLAGSILMLLSSLFLLALPIYFLQFAFILNSLWPSLFLGGLLLVMALIQLFLPSYSVLTGSIGIVISLVTFITTSFGGFGIGMLLGIIGGALSIAWRPVKRSRLEASSSSSTKA